MDEALVDQLSDAKTDEPSFRSQMLLKLQSHLDRCLDALESHVKESVFKDNVPAIIAKTDIDSFSGESDEQSQKIIDVYKVFFKLLKKEYASVNEFEIIQKEVHDRLLKIKNDDKSAWDYLINSKMNSTGLRCICHLIQLQRIVYKNSSADTSLLDACGSHVVFDYYGTVLGPSFGEMKSDLATTNNDLIKAEFILSSSSPVNEKMAQLTASSLLLPADISSDMSNFIKNYYAALFFLTVPCNQNCFAAAKNAVIKLSKAGYFIDYDKGNVKTDKHFLLCCKQEKICLLHHYYNDKTNRRIFTLIKSYLICHECILLLLLQY